MLASELAHQDDAAAAAAGVAALPPELLRHVLSFLLPANEQPAPLFQVARTWHTLRLVCTTWAQAVADMPVAVQACVPLPAVLPWLHRHATALRLVPPPRDVSQMYMLQWVWDHCGPLTLHRTGAAYESMLHADTKLTYDEFVKQLALMGGRCIMLSYRSSLFVPPGTRYLYTGNHEPLPMLQLADMQRLQVLDVQCGCSGTGSSGVHTFHTAVVARLPALRELTLRGFAEPCLWGLPGSLRVLRVLGGHLNEVGLDQARCPRRFFSPLSDCRLDLVELVGYNRLDGLPAMPSVDQVVQMFHSGPLSKVLLSSLVVQCRHIRTDAQVLFLRDPNPILTTKRWVESDLDLQVFASNNVEAAVEALAHTLQPAEHPRLEQLEVVAGAQLVLPSGALVTVGQLAEPAGLQLMHKRWPGLQVQRQQEQQQADPDGRDWLLLSWPPRH